MRCPSLVLVVVCALGSVAAAQSPPGRARYQEALAKDPHDRSAFLKLVELHRKAGTLDALELEYRTLPAHWATLVVLGFIHHERGDDPAALIAWDAAVKLRADDAETWLLIGAARAAGKEPALARAAFDSALAHAERKATKVAALRKLIDLELAAANHAAVDGHFQELVKLEPRNAQVWLDYGDAMLAGSRRQVALDAYSVALPLVASDQARKAEVIARRGQALEGMGRDDDAIAEYERAIRTAPQGYYLENEATGRIVDIHRRHQTLPALLAKLEAAWPVAGRRHFEWRVLGTLYEETGDTTKAIAALQRAVAKAPLELDTQRRLINLLEVVGRDDEVIAQLQTVVRVAPGEARFQLQLAEWLWHKRSVKARVVLEKLVARFPKDEAVLSAVADMYERWGDHDKATAIRP